MPQMVVWQLYFLTVASHLSRFFFFLIFILKKYFFIWLCWDLGASQGHSFLPQGGTLAPQLPALGVCSLSQWTIREVLIKLNFNVC